MHQAEARIVEFYPGLSHRWQVYRYFSHHMWAAGSEAEEQDSYKVLWKIHLFVGQRCERERNFLSVDSLSKCLQHLGLCWAKARFQTPHLDLSPGVKDQAFGLSSLIYQVQKAALEAEKLGFHNLHSDMAVDVPSDRSIPPTRWSF